MSINTVIQLSQILELLMKTINTNQTYPEIFPHGSYTIFKILDPCLYISNVIGYENIENLEISTIQSLPIELKSIIKIMILRHIYLSLKC